MLKTFCGTRILFVRRAIFHVPQLGATAMRLSFRRGQVYQSFHGLSARRRNTLFHGPGLNLAEGVLMNEVNKAGVIQI
jgi:hypothetical protein